MSDTNSAAEITCTKETGKYNPSHLARCGEFRPIETGYGSNTLTMKDEWVIQANVNYDPYLIASMFPAAYELMVESSTINSACEVF